ncbi:MAG: hypothetical protein IKB55_04155 [Clostridia bacterium]|nr:hypothetical protein [Clostridia bacterium]
MAQFLDSRSGGGGVGKNDPDLKGIDKFFELLKRKFGSYVKLNLLYLVLSIPTIIYYTYLLLFLFYDALNDMNAIALFFLALAGATGLVTLFSGTPCSSGYYYVLRNYVREEHAWVLSDMFEHTRRNFLSSLGSYLINVIFVTVALVNIAVFPDMINAMGINLYTILLVAVFAFFVVFYAMMQPYIWTLTVTFDLSFTNVYRNSFILTILKLPRNFGSLLLRAGLFVLAYFLHPMLGILLSLIALTSIIGLISQLMAYPVIDQYMMNKSEEKEEECEDEDEDEYDLGYEPHGPNDIAGLFKNRNKDDDNEPV